MAVNDERCKERRMRASCVPDCYDEINDIWLKSCQECNISGLIKHG